MKRVRVARARIVPVLPPMRPADGDAFTEVALASVPGDIRVTVPDVPPVSVAPVELASLPAEPVGESGLPLGKAVAVLPPLRPSLETEATAVAEEPDTIAPSSGRVAAVRALPPARPDFEASARPDVAAVAPDGEAFDAAPVVAAVRRLPPVRPAFRVDAAFLNAEAPPPSAAPVQPASLFGSLFSAPFAAATAIGPAVMDAGQSVVGASRAALNRMISLHARENDVPEELVHRVVVRESKYNPRAVGQGGALGLMQIKHATARSLGYVGPASGLLDADTNLTYAVKYLAGAYKTAGGNYDQAVRYYARGYYYAAKARGARYASGGTRRRGVKEADASGPEAETIDPAASR